MRQVFIIQGNPRGQGRPRATVRGRHASVYEAKEDTMYKQNLAAQVVAQRPHFIGAGIPVEVEAHFYLSRPQAHFGAKGLKPRYEDARPLGKPDVDNMIKAIKDAVKGIVWHDDSQVFRVTGEKHYADTAPHITIEVKSPTVTG